jgi:DNA-binding CsgD family transcriptional regulator
MLRGRDRERRTLHEAFERARAGESATVLLVGEPGIGKTALLEDAAVAAAGMRVLRARGIESEAQIPFAGLLELLRPVLHCVERLPEPQAAALAGALALRPAAGSDRFAVGAATLGVLAAAAEERPVAVLVDDAHWLDRSTAESILFAARRLLADPVAVVLTLREGHPSVFLDAGLPVLALAGLDRETAAALLADHGGPGDAALLERLHRATGGNPLALLELAGNADELAWGPDDAPVRVSDRIARSLLRRADGLSPPARRLLLLAATAAHGELALLRRAAVELGLDVEAIGEARDAGLVHLRDAVVEFRHPLVRSAVYAAATAGERRAAHVALAGALPDAEVDRRAWHLEAAAVGPDDAASAALAQAGARARDRSAYAVAAAAYERATALAVEERGIARLLLAAADCAWLAGLADRAESLLERARRAVDDPMLAAEVDHLRGHIAVRRGRVAEGQRLLRAAASTADPDRAVLMLAEATNASFYAGDAAAMLEASARAEELAADAPGPDIAVFASLARGMALIFNGEGEAGAARIRSAVEALERTDALAARPRLLPWAVMGPLWLRETGAGGALAARALEVARGQAAVGILPFLLMHVARDHAGRDDWRAAAAEYHEGIRLARDSGQRTDLATLLAGLACLEAREGRETETREHATEALGLSEEVGEGLHDVWALAALGDLELALGRPEVAVERLEELDALLRSRGIRDCDVSPAPELVDAYLRLGRTDEAAAAAAAYGEAAQAKGQPWALARALRCRGMVAPAAAFEDCFAEALALHDRTPDVFAAAQTRLACGGRLRRAGRRTQAREHLRAAHEAFEALGARPWVDAAATELAATGERARRRDPATRDELTPQELQVGLLLADGRTTREAAAALFLSPKTIEYHLRNAYRKLGVNSRDQLATALAPRR